MVISSIILLSDCRWPYSPAKIYLGPVIRKKKKYQGLQENACKDGCDLVVLPAVF